ncbi:MAG: hypothetical protein HFG73_06480 [Hungatella sp.]|nr:hypothetical protein [Hungatella sp.]
MKKIKTCTIAILIVMTMAVMAACSRKDSDMNQTTGPSATQSTSKSSQGGMNESSTGSSSSTGTTQDSTARGDRDGADEESTGVIGGMIDDVEDGVDDMLNGDGASTKDQENK